MPATFRQRLAGFRWAPPHHGVLLATSSVHTIGLKGSLTVLALDDTGWVLAARRLTRNTTWRHREAAWILELPDDCAAPRQGSEVTLYYPAETARRKAGR